MSSSASTDTSSQASFIKRHYGLLIIAAMVIPMILAWFMFKTGIGLPEGTRNKGQLVQPPFQVEQLPLRDPDGKLTSVMAGEHRWRILMVIDGICDSACQNLLYLSRQVHIRLAEKANRVERIWIQASVNDADTQSTMDAEHPRLKQRWVHLEDWHRLVSGTPIENDELAGHHLYLVDQEGFLMMQYDVELDGADLLSDLKYLLKYSHE